MKTPDFTTYTEDELIEFTLRSTPEEIKNCVTTLSPTQITIMIKALDQKKSQKWKETIRSVIFTLEHRPHLENVGKGLTIEQLREIVNHTLEGKTAHQWKLSPILVGIPHDLFNQFLCEATNHEIKILQQESVTEPVQHHLTVLSYEMLNRIDMLQKEIDDFIMKLEQLDTNQISREDAIEMLDQIKLYGTVFESLLNKTNKALLIAWNTLRTDLIESLNKVKMSCQKYSIYGIGKPRTKSEPPTGLYATFEEVLFNRYEENNEIKTNRNMSEFNDGTVTETPQDSCQQLRENEPSIESLAKFSVWYLIDYLEVGLLTSITNESEINLDPSKFSEAERAKHREKLFLEAKTNLEKMGLVTFKDLKEALIFSRRSLREYIELWHQR